jgi:hypothetical protein
VNASTQTGDRVTCPTCKKFVGYKREERKKKTETASMSAVDA